MIESSELRNYLISDDWLLLAPDRLGKIRKLKGCRLDPSLKNCPFERLNDQEVISFYPAKKNWEIAVLKNKFPLVQFRGSKRASFNKKLYKIKPAYGYHELLVTKNHQKNFPQLNPKQARLVLTTARNRFREFTKDKKVKYVSFFHNKGLMAGASVFHPHYQLITLPIIPPHIEKSVDYAQRFLKKFGNCVYCEMIKEESRFKERVIFETKAVIAFAPFVSYFPFEVKVFPKRHLAYFEKSSDRMLADVAEALQPVLEMVEKKLKFDYNFFLHSALTSDNKARKSYHWHIKILPRSLRLAGFEIATGFYTNPVDPQRAASVLRGETSLKNLSLRH